MFFSYGIAQQVTRELRATRCNDYVTLKKKNVGSAVPDSLAWTCCDFYWRVVVF